MVYQKETKKDKKTSKDPKDASCKSGCSNPHTNKEYGQGQRVNPQNNH